jgi:DNA ligase-1
MDYSELVEHYEKIESTSKRLEKTKFISELLKNTSKSDIAKVIFLLQGRVFPEWDDQKIGIASRLVIKALNVSTGNPEREIELEWKKTGDLGLTAENLTKKKKQATLFSSKLSITKVFENLKKLATHEGKGSTERKIGLVSEILTSASPKEAKYIVRTLLEDLRVGASSGTLRDAIVWAYFPKVYEEKEEKKEEYQATVKKVQEAYDITNDFSKVVDAIDDGGFSLEKIGLSVGIPLNPMLFVKAKDIPDGFSIVGKPCALEYKIDGFRVQVHKKKEIIKLFTRRLENVTTQFPDIVEFVKKYVKAEECILDSEVVGIDPKTKKWLPFQNISQRIRRKYDLEETAKDVPVMVIAFDILFYDGKSLLKEKFSERRKILEKCIKEQEYKIEIIRQLVTDDLKKAEKFYSESLKLGNEGIMMKSLDSEYKAGARVGFGVKVKPVLETLDLVITGAEWGHGKRAGWMSSFMVSCVDNGKFLEIGKVGTGIKELETKEKEGEKVNITFIELTKLLKPLILKETGTNAEIKPKIVVEVEFEEVQSSNTYSSGYALRFPRLKVIRYDRKADDCSTLKDVERIYTEQRGRG